MLRLGADKAGNTSAKAEGKTYKLSAFQENSPAIKYSSGWKRHTLSGSYGGSVDYATTAGKTATLTFSGFQVAWVSTEGSTRGSATVRLNGGTPSTINTNATSSSTAEIVDTILGSTSSAKKKLVVKLLGAAKHPRVDIDASSSCPTSKIVSDHGPPALRRRAMTFRTPGARYSGHIAMG